MSRCKERQVRTPLTGRGRRKYRSVILDGLGYRGANLNLAFSPFSLYLLSRFG